MTHYHSTWLSRFANGCRESHGDGGHRRRPLRDVAAYEDIAAAQVAVVSLLQTVLTGYTKALENTRTSIEACKSIINAAAAAERGAARGGLGSAGGLLP